MEDILEFIVLLKEWHQHRVDNLNDVIANIKKGVILKTSDGEDLGELTEEQAVYFKAGMQVALDQFETLPFTVSVNEDAEEDLDDENSHD